MNNFVLAISAGMTSPKKEYNALNKRNLYLNYGLLGLCTLLEEKGYNPRMFQGDYNDPSRLLEIIESYYDLNSLKYPILLSISSNFALTWAKEFCCEVKKRYPNAKIVVGGRWVVGDNPDWLSSRIPEADFIAKGLGESYIEDLLYNDRWRSINPRENIETKPFPSLNYRLLYNYKNYHPVIEVSRGCGRGCEFCLEKDMPLTQLKQPERIIKEMKMYAEYFDDDNLEVYFEASLFAPTISWAKKMRKLYKDAGLNIKWRCTSRVDRLTPELINELSQCGMKVIDLGLESASHIQLIRMNKTKKPEDYLQKASSLLRSCSKNNVWVKLNILLFPGESNSTVQETISWLKEHSRYTKGISINPMILYGTNISIGVFKEYGASIHNDDLAKNNGYSNLNLSPEISFEQSINIGTKISKEIMSIGDYFDLKKFGYFSRNYNYIDFINDINTSDITKLPFIVPWVETPKEANGIIIFGGMGSGKNTFVEQLSEALWNKGKKTGIFNIGDTCRLFMGVSSVNDYWHDKQRTLGQMVSTKLREIDVNILNDVILSKIQDLDKDTMPIIVGGRIFEDFKYWTSKKYIPIGMASCENLIIPRLSHRDGVSCNIGEELNHTTETDVNYISCNLCSKTIENNGTIEDLRAKTVKIVDEIYNLY